MLVIAAVWSLDDWANVLSSMARDGELGTCRVFVPNERVAHALRRRRSERKQHVVLAGSRFLPLLRFARRVLAEAGEPAVLNEAELTPVLVREVFRSCRPRLNAQFSNG